MTIFQFLDRFRPLYGGAYDFEEWAERHLYKHQCHWASRPSTAPVGTDVYKYVPGLYWMTCFGPSVLNRHCVDLNNVCGLLGGKLHSLPNSTILQLFDRPYEWADYDLKIAEFLAANRGFFSLSKLEKLPETLSPPEFVVELQRVTRPWP